LVTESELAYAAGEVILLTLVFLTRKSLGSYESMQSLFFRNHPSGLA